MQYISQTFSRHYDYTYIHTYGLIRSRKYMVRDRKYGARLGFLNVCLGLKITRHSHMVEFKNVRNNMANRKIHVCLIALIWSLGKQVGKLSKNLWSTVIFNVLFTGQPRFHETRREKKSREISSANLIVFFMCVISCVLQENVEASWRVNKKRTTTIIQDYYDYTWLSWRRGRRRAKIGILQDIYPWNISHRGTSTVNIANAIFGQTLKHFVVCP